MKNAKQKQVLKEAKKVSIPKVSKAIMVKMEKIEKFDNLKEADKTSYKRLLQVSRLATVENMGLNKALKTFLDVAKGELLPKQIEVLTFNNVKKHLMESKYKDLPLFSMHQITLICNEVVKKHDKNIQRELRVERQNKAIAKK